MTYIFFDYRNSAFLMARRKIQWQEEKTSGKIRNAIHHQDVGKHAKPLKDDIAGYVFFALAHHGDEPFVHHHMYVLLPCIYEVYYFKV